RGGQRAFSLMRDNARRLGLQTATGNNGMAIKSFHHSLAAAAAGVLLLGAVSAGAQQSERFGGVPVLTVSATAEVSIEPDRAIVRLGALAEAEEAADAQNGVNETMQRILDAMRGLG